MDNHSVETFCYEKRCDHNVLGKWCGSYNDRSFQVTAKPGVLRCGIFKKKGTGKKRRPKGTTHRLVSAKDVAKKSIERQRSTKKRGK